MGRRDGGVAVSAEASGAFTEDLMPPYGAMLFDACLKRVPGVMKLIGRAAAPLNCSSKTKHSAIFETWNSFHWAADFFGFSW